MLQSFSSRLSIVFYFCFLPIFFFFWQTPAVLIHFLDQFLFFSFSVQFNYLLLSFLLLQVQQVRQRKTHCLFLPLPLPFAAQTCPGLYINGEQCPAVILITTTTSLLLLGFFSSQFTVRRPQPSRPERSFRADNGHCCCGMMATD